MAIPIRLADPRSSRSRLDGRDGVRRDDHPRQQPRPHGDHSDHEFAVTPQVDPGTGWCDAVGRLGPFAAGGKPGGLAGSVDTADLHRHRDERTDTPDQNHDQRGDSECRFDGDTARFAGQTLVASARLMMLVKALTIESPVTTV